MFNQSGKAGTQVPWELIHDHHLWGYTSSSKSEKVLWHLGTYRICILHRIKAMVWNITSASPPTELCKTEEEIRVAEVFPCLILYTTSM